MTRAKSRIVGGCILVGGLIPFALLMWRGYSGRLGADPVETIQIQTGIWAVRFLLLTLLVTPLVRLAGWRWLVRHRRKLGLFAFAYAIAHLANYIVFDHWFSLAGIAEDVVERTWITFGMAAIIAMLPLAITSTNGWVRRLGGRTWRRLHRLAYVAAIFATIHFILAMKKDITEPLVYAAILALLLGYRAWSWVAARSGRSFVSARRTANQP